MTIRQKYKALNDPDFVKKMVTKSVYGTMQLEDQGIEFARIEQLYEIVEGEKKLKALQRS